MRGRVHRVLATELREGKLKLHGPEAHHLANVLRVKAGAAVEAFDGEGLVATGTISAVGKGEVELTLGPPQRSESEASVNVVVAVALLKGDKLADVVRMCTELGVAGFKLFVSRRCDATNISPARLTRLKRVAEEAARQSGRARVPYVHEPVPLSELGLEGLTLVGDPQAGTTFKSAWEGALAGGVQETVTLVTGPEGGIGEAEVDDLVSRSAQAISLGPRILRAETAPVALAASVLLGAEA